MQQRSPEDRRSCACGSRAPSGTIALATARTCTTLRSIRTELLDKRAPASEADAPEGLRELSSSQRVPAMISLIK